MPFHYVVNTTFTAGVLSMTLAPALFPRVQLEADVWAHFRVRKLSFRLLPTSPSTVAQALGFVGGIEDTPPSTFQQVTELIPSTIKGVGQTVPSPWVHVPKRDLAGPFPWYKTVPGTADSTEESPGQCIAVGTGTEAVTVEFKGVIEFKTSLNSANTPLAVRLREMIRKERQAFVLEAEKNRLLKVMAGSSVLKEEKPTGGKLDP